MSNTGTGYCPKCYVEFFCPGDRHPKWVKVDPGTVIPAGQPYRVEYAATGLGGACADERIAKNGLPAVDSDADEWFVDSSWKPPLDLPTKPTWALVVWVTGITQVAQWHREAGRTVLYGNNGTMIFSGETEHILEFIPLTSEQVSRLEACG